MKCMQMILPGREVCAAILPIGMEDVLVDKITSGGQILSRSLKILNLRSSLSTAASTIKSADSISFKSVVVVILPRIEFLSFSDIFSFFTILSRFLEIVANPFSQNSSLISLITTSRPLAAATCAIPLPI